jgi:hypothetical protein
LARLIIGRSPFPIGSPRLVAAQCLVDCHWKRHAP